jgi:cytoskeletal protein RodZ
MTLGRLFRGAREARGIPVERAAHETRIRAACLRDLERDDHSQMSPAYARLFVRDYARYLDLREEDIRPYLPEAGVFGVDGYAYLRNTSGPGPHVPRHRVPRRTRRKAIFAAAAALILAAIGVQGFILIRKLEAINTVGGATTPESPEVAVSAELVTTPDPATVEVLEFRAVGEELEEAGQPPPAPAPPAVPERSSDPHAADALFVNGIVERGADTP